MTRPIVHPTDFSPASGRAFAKAIALAKATRSELIVLHVLNPTLPVVTDRPISPPTLETYRQAVRTWASGHLRRLVTRARTAGVRARPILREGAEAREIARTARSRRAAMIVMGTHGRTGVAKFMLGSVAERVLGLSACPVLTVRGRSAR